MNAHTEPHIVSVKTNLTVFVALAVLTVLTVTAAYFDLGALNVFVAVTVAVVKSCLVVLYFMHLRSSAHILWVVAGAGVIWFVLLVGLTLSDFLTRGWLPAPDTW